MALNDKTYQPLQAIGIEAAEDLPAFRFVSHLGSLCADGERAFGVTEVNWLNGEFASVVTLGTIAIECSTNVDIGDDITSAINGKARPAVNDEPVNGRAMDSVSGTGFVRIKLVP
jgi:hypothetical protein